MIISLQKFIERLKFILLFIVLTFICSVVYQYIAAWIEPNNPYAAPQGNAVKAFEPHEGQEVRYDPLKRLKFFYWYGE